MARKLFFQRSLAIVAVTVLADDERAVAALQAGAEDVLVAGLHGAELARAIRHAIERRRQRHALSDSEANFRHFIEGVRDHAICVLDPRGTITTWNGGAERLYGYSAPEIIGKNHTLLFTVDEVAAGASHRLLEMAVSLGQVREEGWRVRKDGGQFWANGSLTARFDANGLLLGFCQVVRDLTEGKTNDQASHNALEQFRRSKEEFQLLFDRHPHPMWVFDLDTLEFLAVNQMAAEHYGYSREEFLSMSCAEIRPSEDVPLFRDYVANLEPGIHHHHVWRHRLKNGRIIRVEISTQSVDWGGRRARLVLAVDVTRRLEAEEAVRVSEERFRLLASATTDAIWEWDPVHNTAWWSEGFHTLFGHDITEMMPPLETWLGLIHPDDRQMVADSFHAVVASGAHWSMEYRFLCKNGKYAYVLDRGHVIRDDAGRAVRMIGGMTDLTEQKNLEIQLFQSQKMEAIGQLAGGVAHDFNNLLTIINGYSDVLMTLMPTTDSKHPMIAHIRAAGERAASLTRQLLAFSRKQVLAPQILDLNAAIASIEVMMQRLIGEDIRITTVLQPRLARIRVDPGQLEQVIVNLVVNARDAMPRGGRLTIETANVVHGPEHDTDTLDLKHGEYVALTVSDTGFGMSAEVREHIFEPFFSTKEPGKGTGLGLATVFGIVKQSEGYIDVYSEIGVGTRFKILFPAIGDVSRLVQANDLVSPPPGTETVLLVEDEPGVRAIARIALEHQGYQLLEAASGREALQRFEIHPGKIDLVITDVVMPEMSGRELIEQLRRQHPQLKYLYMSGYTDDAVVRHGVIEATDAFLQKPFSPLSLARKVRELLLDARAGSP